jgi:hypothetical protein
MGFLVQYKFYKEIIKGEYNKDEILSGDIKVGSPYEDVPIESLAGKIMALMARRNILVTEVEIFEIEKKKISYKEFEDGIVIKNRKFRFDDGPAVEAVEEAPSDPAVLLSNPQVQAALKFLGTQKLAIPTVPAASNIPAITMPVALGNPIRAEVYTPKEVDPIWVRNSERLNGGALALTQGKRYPIYEEKMHPAGQKGGMLYVTVDDNGKKVVVSDKLFQLPQNLIGGDTVSVQKEEPKLLYQEKKEPEMPVLRR